MPLKANRYSRSKRMYKNSMRYLAGGVSSMLRASCKPTPLFFQNARGAWVTDVDGNRYVDYALAWGPLILGNSHPEVVKAIEKQLKKFYLIGAQHDLEAVVAKRICRMVPSAQLVAFSNTGSEAVQLALRLARAFTGKTRFIKFEGHYHGWMDSVLISYHPSPVSGQHFEPVPASEGQSKTCLDDAVVLPWNDLASVERALEDKNGQIAAIILEPILCNTACLLPVSGYLEGLRDLSRRHGVVLIFDEVITGFRVAPGGAQELLQVIPDLTVLGKAVAGGLPMSVVAGRRDILRLIHDGRVAHAGTFNGNPIALAAAEATLDMLSANCGERLTKIRTTGEALMTFIANAASEEQIPLQVNGVGAAFHLAFTNRKEPLKDYRSTLECDTRKRDQFIVAMLNAGVYLLPDGRWYVSAAHDYRAINHTMVAVKKSFQLLRQYI